MDSQSILMLASVGERKSLEKYLEFARDTRDPKGKDMFIRLALDEYHHWETIEKQIQLLTETRSISQSVAIPPSLIEPLIPKLSKKNLLIKGQEKQDDLTALQTALELEHSARNFYQEQATNASGNVKQLLLRLAEIEQIHLELIQAELDSIQQTGFWFGFPEFTLEGNP